MCGVVINGHAHGPDAETTTCQLHMRRFRDGDTIVHRTLAGEGLSPCSGTLVVDRTATGSDHPSRAVTFPSTPETPPMPTAFPMPRQNAELSL